MALKVFLPAEDIVILSFLFRLRSYLDCFLDLYSDMIGTIAGAFGKSGKFKVFFPGGTGYTNEELVNKTITLPMKRYIFDKSKKIQQ
jgi:hypothetical protein